MASLSEASDALSTVTGGRYAIKFGQRVRRLRETRGLSQEALADAAHLHRTHISLIERGQRSVRIETIERLALALHVQPSLIMPRINLPKHAS